MRPPPRQPRSDPVEGNVGAGTGASVGKLFGITRAMRGGIGSASVEVGDAVVGAIVAVNAVGDVRDPDTGLLIAGTREAPDSLRLSDSAALLRSTVPLVRFAAPQNTTIGIVATNARLSKAEAAKVAALGLPRLRPRALASPHGVRRRHAVRALRGRRAGGPDPPGVGRRRYGRPRHRPRACEPPRPFPSCPQRASSRTRRGAEANAVKDSGRRQPSGSGCPRVSGAANGVTMSPRR